MKNRYTIILLFALILSYSTATAQEGYPDFDRSYWENEQELAQGKIVRGTALGIAGVVLIWPTAVMISRAKENPHKYIPLSIIFGAASAGAMGHGFSSIGSGKRQRENADYWVERYTSYPDSIDLGEQQEDYLYFQQESTRKSTLFGVYSISVATALLTNGIVQSSRSKSDIESDDITIWPYYTAGGVLLPMGIFSIIRSRKKAQDLDDLEAISRTASSSQFFPYVTLSRHGQPLFGAFYSRTF